MGARLLLIGLDGLDPVFMGRHLDALPNLASVVRAGVSGRLRSTVPPVTTVAWPTAMSGMDPGKTGLSCFRESDFVRRSGRIPTSREVLAPRIWNVLSHLGRRCAAIGVPMTFPVEAVNGVMVAGFPTPSGEGTFAHPEAIQDELLRIGYVPSFEYGSYGAGERARFLQDLYATSEVKFGFVEDLLQREAWDAFVFCASETDWVQHFFDRGPHHPDHAQNEQLIADYFAYVDRFLGRWIRAAGEGAHILVMSDHGFGRFVQRNVHVNTLLMRLGYLAVANSKAAALRHWVGAHLRSLGRLPGASRLRRHVSGRTRHAGFALTRAHADDFDWGRTQAYLYSVHSGVGCIRLIQGQFEDKTQYLAARERIVAAVRALRDPRHDGPLVERVFLQGELYGGPSADGEPEIIFLFAEGCGGVDVVAPDLVVDIPPGFEPGAGHRLHGMYALAGHGIPPRPGPDAGIADIAPTAYALLGVPVPRECDGHVIASSVDEVRRDYGEIPRQFIDCSRTADEDASVLLQLQALGYV